MESVTVELYIIAYTLIGILLLWLYSLPLRIISRGYKGIKNIFNNNRWWGIY